MQVQGTSNSHVAARSHVKLMSSAREEDVDFVLSYDAHDRPLKTCIEVIKPYIFRTESCLYPCLRGQGTGIYADLVVLRPFNQNLINRLIALLFG